VQIVVITITAATKSKTMDWKLEIAFHWPHDRFSLGWEFMNVDEEYDYRTLKVFVFIVTLTLDF